MYYQKILSTSPLRVKNQDCSVSLEIKEPELFYHLTQSYKLFLSDDCFQCILMAINSNVSFLLVVLFVSVVHYYDIGFLVS